MGRRARERQRKKEVCERERGEEKKKLNSKENQYFSSVTTQAAANDSKHHEKIWEKGQERNEKDKGTVK